MSEEHGKTSGILKGKHGKIVIVGAIAVAVYFVYRSKGSSQASAPAAPAAIDPAALMGYANPGGNYSGIGGSQDGGSNAPDWTSQFQQLQQSETAIATALGSLGNMMQQIQQNQTTVGAVPTGSGSSTTGGGAVSVKSGGSTKGGGGEPMIGIGSQGAWVKTLQQDLGITADGIYGQQTAAAVRAYQQAHGLQVDGIAGNQTWGSIDSGGTNGYHTPGNVVNYYAPKSTSKPAPSSSGRSSSGGQPTLGYGSTGASVKALQQKLGITADGIFGAQTKAAVENYQRSHGLSVDGIVGNQTWGSLTNAPRKSSGARPN